MNTYFPQRHKRRRHRGRRDLDKNKHDSEGDVAVEEIIEKESQTQTEAVGGITTEGDEFPYMVREVLICIG